MRYYRLMDDVYVQGRWHLSDVTSSTGDALDLLNGAALDHQTTLSVPVHEQGDPLDFSLTSFAIPVATRELSRVIKSVAGDDLQEIPLEVDGYGPFVVPHSTRGIRCLDEGRSEFQKWTKYDRRADLAGDYMEVSRLVLDTQAIPADAHFFRVEGWQVALIVSETVKEAMEAAGCRGAVFQEVTEE